MRILVVSQFYYPEPFQKLKDLCEGFVNEGHEVTVLTGLPNYPTGIIEYSYRDSKNRNQNIGGVEVIRVPLIPRRSTKIGLALNYLSWSLTASIKVLTWPRRNFDVVFCYQTSPVLMLFPAWLAKKRFGVRLVGYCLDLWPVSMLAMLKSERSLAFRIMKVISRWLYKQCDVLAVTSRPFMDYFNKVHGIQASLKYIPQHGNDEYLTVDFSGNTKDKVHFLFTGNMGQAQDLLTILKAVQKVKSQKKFVVDFVGNGSAFDECSEFIKNQHLEDKVILHGRKPYSDLPKWYSLADACLVTLKHENAIGLTLPGKMQDYLAAGKPIIGAIDGSAREVIREAECGLCVESGNFKALAEAFDNFLENPEKFMSCGCNARSYYTRNFVKKKIIAQFMAEFER